MDRRSTINIISIVEELESISDSATKVPGLKKWVMVDPDRLHGVVKELATAIPADIQEAQEVIRQKESIINQAHLEARRTNRDHIPAGPDAGPFAE